MYSQAYYGNAEYRYTTESPQCLPIAEAGTFAVLLHASDAAMHAVDVTYIRCVISAEGAAATIQRR